MRLRIATILDYREVADMYKELLLIVYSNMKVGADIFIDGVVQGWFSKGHDIILSEKEDGTVTGFSMAYIEDAGIVERYYMGELAYVKPEYRKGRSAWLLYKNVIEYGEKLGLPIVAKAAVIGDDPHKVSQIQAKFGVPQFIEYVRIPNLEVQP